jgi:hypothetical protein
MLSLAVANRTGGRRRWQPPFDDCPSASSATSRDCVVGSGVRSPPGDQVGVLAQRGEFQMTFACHPGATEREFAFGVGGSWSSRSWPEASDEERASLWRGHPGSRQASSACHACVTGLSDAAVIADGGFELGQARGQGLVHRQGVA